MPTSVPQGCHLRCHFLKMIYLADAVVLLRLTLQSFRAQEHPFLKIQSLLAVLHLVTAMVIGKAGTTARKVGLQLIRALPAKTFHEGTLRREHQGHPQQVMRLTLLQGCSQELLEDYKRRKLQIHPPSVQILHKFLNPWWSGSSQRLVR